MAFNRAHYPANWPELSHAAKTAAGWRCSECGAAHGALLVSHRNRLYRVVLSACHLDHDPTNPTPRLTVFCQACHLRYDAFQRWRSRRRQILQRMLEAGQLAFPFEEWLDLNTSAVSSAEPELLQPHPWPERTDITAPVYARMRRTADRPLTLIQQRNIHHAAPEFRASDTELARFLVALVEEAIARNRTDERRALVLLEQLDSVTPSTVWSVPAPDAQRVVRRVTPQTRTELSRMLDGYAPTRCAVLLLLTTQDARLFIADDQGGLHGPGIRPRPARRPGPTDSEHTKPIDHSGGTSDA